jgi:hypothetical protein
MGNRIIALCGHKHSGKSTLAQDLSKHVGDCIDKGDKGSLPGGVTAVKVVSFGDALRAAVRQVFRLSDEEITDLKDEPISRLGGASGRDCLVNLGEGVKSIYPNVWLDHLASKIFQHNVGSGYTRGQCLYIIDDLRRQNEYDWIKAKGHRSLVLRCARRGQHVPTVKEKDYELEHAHKKWESDLVVCCNDRNGEDQLNGILAMLP